MGAALVAVCGRLIAEASPVAHGPQGVQASVAVPRGLCSTGSIVAADRFTCSETCEIFPDQGLSSCLLPWQTDSLPLSRQGSPSASIIHTHISILFQILFPYRLLRNAEQSSWSCVKMQKPGSAHILLQAKGPSEVAAGILGDGSEMPAPIAGSPGPFEKPLCPFWDRLSWMIKKKKNKTK